MKNGKKFLFFVIAMRHTPPMAQGHRCAHRRFLITAIAIIARFVRFDTRRGLSPRLNEGQRVLVRPCRDGQPCDALAAAEFAYLTHVVAVQRKTQYQLHEICQHMR